MSTMQIMIFKKYITDILFEDEKGWISIIGDGKYDCNIIRINERRFNLNFQITSYDMDGGYNIFIDDNIDIL